MKLFKILMLSTFVSFAAQAASDSLAIEEPLPSAKLIVGAPVSEESVDTVSELPANEESIAKIPENEIPVLTGVKQAKRAEGGSLSKIMITLGIMIVALGALFVGLKRWAARRGAGISNPKIKVLTQYSLGPKKGLAIVHVAGESILIGVTDHNISMLKTLSLIDDEVPEGVPNHFGHTLSDLESDPEEEPYDDEFAVRGIGEIRDRVSGRVAGHVSSGRSQRGGRGL